MAAADGSRITVEIILRDRVTGTTRHVSRSVSGGQPNGRSADPALSADGHTIAFSSLATDLVEGPDDNGPASDVYLFHVPTGVTRRISLTDAGAQPREGGSMAPAISADGRFVAFTSTADLAPGGPPRQNGAANVRTMHVYVRDTTLGRTFRIAPGAAPNGSSSMAAISHDGRFVAFASTASNLVAGDRNRSSDVFLYDRRDDAITLVSRGAGGRPGNGTSALPAMSADGTTVAFQSVASDLTSDRSANDVNLLPDVFLFDRRTGAIARASEDDAGGWMEESGAPVLDASGTVVAFTSKHPIDAEDEANDFDLFVRVTSAPR
jgi:Tol biopolymer transport system component